MEKKVKILLTITLTFLSISTQAFNLTPENCKLVSGKAGDKLKIMDGDKIAEKCDQKGKELVCDKTKLQNWMVVEGKGIGFNDAGNIKLVVDFQKEKYIYGMVYFDPNSLAILTKTCEGKAK